MTWTERKTLETPRRILTFTISCTPFLHVIIKNSPFPSYNGILPYIGDTTWAYGIGCR